jgi:hypothetical protein
MEGKFVLLQVAVKATDQYLKNKAIDDLLSVAKDQCTPSSGIEELALGVWLIDLRKNAPFLGRICAVADQNLPYRLLFLEQAPEWITYGEWK